MKRSRTPDRSERLTGLRSLTMALVTVALAACGGGGAETTSNQVVSTTGATDTPSGQAEPGDGRDALVTATIGDMSWEFDSVACITGSELHTLSVAAPPNAFDLSKPHLVINVDDPAGEGLSSAENLVSDVSIRAADSMTLTLNWRSTSDHGGVTVDVEGRLVTAEGLFDDETTAEIDESLPGSIEVDCGEEIVVPAQAAAEPEPTADGFVTVGGETFSFTYGSPPQCGLAGTDGRVVSYGRLTTDPSRQVVLTYGLAENTSNGSPSMQIIIYGADNQQLWFSQVGFGGGDIGSIESIELNGNTVAVTGNLADGSDTSVLAPFTAEATCTP
jgi:hypothetical protein